MLYTKHALAVIQRLQLTIDSATLKLTDLNTVYFQYISFDNQILFEEKKQSTSSFKYVSHIEIFLCVLAFKGFNSSSNSSYLVYHEKRFQG